MPVLSQSLKWERLVSKIVDQMQCARLGDPSKKLATEKYQRFIFQKFRGLRGFFRMTFGPCSAVTNVRKKVMGLPGNSGGLRVKHSGPVLKSSGRVPVNLYV